MTGILHLTFSGSAVVALPRLREDKHYIRIYVHWMYFIFIFAVPFIVLSLVNGMVVLTIQKAKRDRRHLTRQQRKEHATAALMVIVAFVYISKSLTFRPYLNQYRFLCSLQFVGVCPQRYGTVGRQRSTRC